LVALIITIILLSKAVI